MNIIPDATPELLATLRAYDRAANYLLEAAEESNSELVRRALAYHAAGIRALN